MKIDPTSSRVRERNLWLSRDEVLTAVGHVRGDEFDDILDAFAKCVQDGGVALGYEWSAKVARAYPCPHSEHVAAILDERASELDPCKPDIFEQTCAAVGTRPNVDDMFEKTNGY